MAQIRLGGVGLIAVLVWKLHASVVHVPTARDNWHVPSRYHRRGLTAPVAHLHTRAMDAPIAIPALVDNYIWLVPTAGGGALVVDPGDAVPVFAALDAHRLCLSAIFCTHHHRDHSGGIATLTRAFPVPVYAPANESVAAATHPVHGGMRIAVDDLTYNVLDIPGHTAGHIAFVGDGHVFCGDTLFSGGCGRLFEGTAAQLYASLRTLAELPADTAVYCGHEYTVANLRFALTVEPDNVALQERHAWACAQRAAGHPTLPSTIGRERAINPFLRTHIPAVRQPFASELDHKSDTETEVFARLRRRKDDFKG